MELESRKGRGMERHQRKSRRKRNGRFPYLLQIREDTICKNNVGCHSQSIWELLCLRKAERKQEEDEVEAQFHRRRHHQDDDDDDEDEVEQIREQR